MAARKRVNVCPAHVIMDSSLERGGAENQLVSLANDLADREWKVTVVSYLPFPGRSLQSKLAINMLCPLSIVKVPTHRFFDASLDIHLRPPAQQLPGLGYVRPR